jgi:hypothetical protein
MEYTSINEQWEEYKSQIREPLANLKQLERVFRDGYIRGFDKREQKQQLIELMNSETKVNRLEIINHTQTDKEIGRIFVCRGDIELDFQDSGKTLKIFI